jgi:hypothetical protein
MDVTATTVIVLATLVAFGVAVAAMALGGKLTGRCLRSDGEPLSCATCPNRKRSTP